MGKWKMTKNLKVGDVVRLNSGGPPMVVKFIDGENENHVTVMWQVHDQHPYIAHFPGVCLTRVKKAK